MSTGGYNYAFLWGSRDMLEIFQDDDDMSTCNRENQENMVANEQQFTLTFALGDLVFAHTDSFNPAQRKKSQQELAIPVSRGSVTVKLNIRYTEEAGYNDSPIREKMTLRGGHDGLSLWTGWRPGRTSVEQVLTLFVHNWWHSES
ncbi:hypothetical protein DL770_004751 [Monosporascus sp. CRB-9-2]|nr:hypothetical protein DL770_004751 [Monosporascus sp. CRB-9-2]